MKATLEVEVGSAVGALSRLPDGRVLAGPLRSAAYALDVDTGAVERLGPEGQLDLGRLRVLGGNGPAAMVGLSGCEYVFVDVVGRVVERRKTGFQRSYTQPERFAVHPAGTSVVLHPPDGVPRLHDVAKGRNANLKGLSGQGYDVLFDPTGKTLAAQASCRQAMVWDVATKKLLATFAAPAPAVLSLGLAFTAAGDRVVANFWNPPPEGQTAAVHTFAVFSVATGALERTVPGIGSIALALLDDDRVIVTTTTTTYPLSYLVEVRSLTDGALLGRAKVPALQRHVLPLDDDRFAVGGDDGVVRVFSARALAAGLGA